MKNIMKIIFKLFNFISRVAYRIFVMPFKKAMLKGCGKDCLIGRGSNLTYHNISLGDNVSIGNNAMFMCTRAEIKIGNNVMFGPHVFIITGGHRTDMIGRYMIDIKNNEKSPENDQDIVIEDDVWIGANAIILKGVTISTGSVIAAGSIVTKNVEPYSIVGGVPAKLIRKRFSEEELSRHKAILRK